MKITGEDIEPGLDSYRRSPCNALRAPPDISQLYPNFQNSWILTEVPCEEVRGFYVAIHLTQGSACREAAMRLGFMLQALGFRV